MLEVYFTWIANCSLRIVHTSAIPSARRRVSRAKRHLCVLRTKEGPRVSIVVATKAILIFTFVASLGKYAFFRIQNPYLFVTEHEKIGLMCTQKLTTFLNFKLQ